MQAADFSGVESLRFGGFAVIVQRDSIGKSSAVNDDQVIARAQYRRLRAALSNPQNDSEGIANELRAVSEETGLFPSELADLELAAFQTLAESLLRSDGRLTAASLQQLKVVADVLKIEGFRIEETLTDLSREPVPITHTQARRGTSEPMYESAKMRRAAFIGMGLAPAVLLVVGLITGQWAVAVGLAVAAVCFAALLADRATAERNRARSGSEDQSINAAEGAQKQARERALGRENTRRVEASKPEYRRLWVKEYKNAREFDKDGQLMVADGWSVGQQSQGSTHMNLGRTVFSTVATGGLNLLTPKVGGASYTKGKITVTWVRP